MTTPPPPGSQRPGFDRFVVVSVATTTDEHGVYVTKESAEVVELGWLLLDAKTLQEIDQDSVLIRPVNTPITPLCTSLTTLTWDNVKNAGDFKAAVQRFDSFWRRHLKPQDGQLGPNWAFVTLDAWDLRVQLPREARDKSVVLPYYLQHSVTFDLRKEYQMWQVYHPEALPFGSSSLANICAALEVEPVSSSAPIKHNLPFHLQALAPSAPRRATEEALTLSRILKGLLAKSQPASEHPNILVQPLDASADIRAFIQERSKVLHMSGLPNDTTQSELESWYTQFGGRPIAFYTFRTPEQAKPPGTGFAVFSSHEEAAESLCMNGRALNEVAIEISPSSGRVLDRAQDIIVPFPPSKNRPRPGDWTCQQCGFSNFQRRTACFRCSFSPMGSGPVDHSMNYGYGYGAHMMSGPHQGYGHGMGGGHHHGGGGRHGGAMIPFRPGDWKCGAEGCNYHNFAKNVACLRCGASRSTAAVAPDASPYPQANHMPVESHGQHGMYGPPSMAGTPGPAAYGPHPTAYAPGGGYHGHQYGGPANSYAIQSGMAAGGPYGQMNTPHFQAGPGAQSQAGYESRTAEAFSSAGATPSNAGGYSGYDNGRDPFSFLTTGLSGLSVNDENRRQPPNSSKSPTN